MIWRNLIWRSLGPLATVAAVLYALVGSLRGDAPMVLFAIFLIVLRIFGAVSDLHGPVRHIYIDPMRRVDGDSRRGR